MKTSSITMLINYAGIQLPIHKNPIGEDITPLKPIVDLFGLQWKGQRKKITESTFYRHHLGIFEGKNDDSGTPRCTSNDNSEGSRPLSNPTYLPEIFIRVDRVAAYLMTINPEQVRSQGNTTSADFLEQKITEWSDALHDYESMGFAVNLNHHKYQSAINRQRKEFAQMIAIKNKTPERSDRHALNQIIEQMADELDIKYQQELLD